MPSSGNERIAKTLGYAGLLPFVMFSAGSWWPLPLVDDPATVLAGYGAVILSFMGAIHWGIAMTDDDKRRSGPMIVSVVPALVAWLALLLPVAVGLLLLLAAFAALYGYDRAFARLQALPAWYLSMRGVLTLIVTCCLGIAWLSLL